MLPETLTAQSAHGAKLPTCEPVEPPPLPELLAPELPAPELPQL